MTEKAYRILGIAFGVYLLLAGGSCLLRFLTGQAMMATPGACLLPGILTFSAGILLIFLSQKFHCKK